MQEDSNITTSTSGNGDAGSLTIDAEQINSQNSTISTGVAASGRGNAGNLTISTQRLQLRGDANINSLVQGVGDAGNLTIEAEQIDLRGLGTSITTQISSGGRGRGGDLDIRTQRLQVQENAQVSTTTSGIGDAGNLRILAKEIELVNTSDPNNIFTGLFTSVDNGGIGDAGSLKINTDRLIIRNGASISSEVFRGGQGQGGDIKIRARDGIDIIGFVPVTTNDIYNTSGIFTTTSGQGDAGNILIRSGNGVILRQRGRISSASLAGGRGNAGDIDLRTTTLTLSGGGNMLASVSGRSRNNEGVELPGGRGTGGNVQITASDAIRISGSDSDGLPSRISASTGRGAFGRAGTITLNTDNLQINNGGIVIARTLNSRRAGEVTVNANTFAATNGGQILTNTEGPGKAGTINLDITDEISVSGVDPNFADRRNRVHRFVNRLDRGDLAADLINNQGANSRISANTTRSGRGGEINLQTQNLSLNDGATISTTSQRQGRAGNIRITAVEQLQSAGGNITTINLAIKENAI